MISTLSKVGWLAPLISDASPSCMATGEKIDIKYMNVRARYWFGFISSNIIP